jgi:hypothetical protein
MLGRLSGGLDLPESECGDGPCGECSRRAAVRYTLGAFELCRRCAGRRLDVRKRIHAESQP